MVNHSELQNQRIAQIPATWAIEESPTTNHNKPNRIKPQLGTVKSCAFKFNTTQTWILKAGKQTGALFGGGQFARPSLTNPLKDPRA